MEKVLTNYYIKGFNNAYYLAKYQSEVLEMILRTSTDNDYIQGLKDGKKTYELEQQKNRINELQNLRSQGDKGLELDR